MLLLKFITVPCELSPAQAGNAFETTALPPRLANKRGWLSHCKTDNAGYSRWRLFAEGHCWNTLPRGHTIQEHGPTVVSWLRYVLGCIWGYCMFMEGATVTPPFVKPVVGIQIFAFIYSSLCPSRAECIPPSSASSSSSAVMVQTHPNWWVKPIQELVDWSKSAVDPYFPSPKVDAARVEHMWTFCLTSHSRGFSPWDLSCVRVGEGP